MNKKRIGIIVTSVAAAAVICIGGFFGIKIIGENNYWNAPPINNIDTFCDYSDADLSEMMESYDIEEQEIIDYIKTESKNIDNKHSKKIEQLNKVIADFFEKNYQLDVSERLDQLEVRTADFESYQIGGYYNNYDGNNIVYVEQDKLGYEDYTEFEQTYVHETMHYLGTAEKGSGNIAYIYEGITQYLTIEIFKFGKLNDGNLNQVEDTYAECVDVAQEIIKQSPEIIKNIIEGEGTYDLEQKLNLPFNNQNFADKLNMALHETLNVQNSNGEYIVRLLVCEYVKATGGTDVDLDICKNFGWQWIFN